MSRILMRVFAIVLAGLIEDSVNLSKTKRVRVV